MTTVIRQPRVEIKDEGISQGRASIVDFTGAGVTASVSGQTATVNIAGGAGGANWTETEIDFGSAVPKYDASFVVVDAAVSAVSKVAVVSSGKVATSRVGDDHQWDALMYAALPAAGSFTLYVQAFPGPVKGARKIQYQIA